MNAPWTIQSRGMSAVAADGIRLHGTEWSGADDPLVTVVFLHGMCLDQRTWHDHARRAATATGAQVIAYDHRGHGSSDEADPATYRVDVLAADLGNLIDTAVPAGRTIVLVGHSMGGMAALEYVTGDHPRSADVGGLVLCSTSGGGLSEAGPGKALLSPLAAVAATVGRKVPPGIVRAAATAVSAVAQWKDPYMADHHPLAATILNAITTASPRTAAGFITGLTAYDCRDKLGHLTFPVRLMSGGVDCLTPPEHAQALEDRIPRILHMHFPTAGHMIPQTRSEDVAAAVEVAVADAAAGRLITVGRGTAFRSG